MKGSFVQIAKFVEDRIGLNSGAMTREWWRRIINKRMEICNIHDVDLYYSKLIHSAQEFQEVVELIVVPETWFFRDRSSLDFLARNVKHKWLHQPNRAQVFKILSVPCSTGEEPYSIAMTLLKAGIPPLLFHIDAVDISKKAIEKAELGVYEKRSFRNTDYFEGRKEFFIQSDNKFLIQKTVRDRVTFFCENVFDIEFQRRGPYHVIFCRNLLIYLDAPHQKRLLEILNRQLSPAGLLFVGPAESELLHNLDYISIPYLKACAFKRRSDSIKQRLQKPSQIIVKPEEDDAKIQFGAKPALLPSNLIPNALFAVPSKVIEEEKGQDIKKQRAEISLEKASKFANQGKFEEAMEGCLNYLKEQGPDPEGYFLLGVIEHAMKHEDLAEEFFLKTIYLNPFHYTALVYLTLLAEKKGNVQQAELFRSRATRSANLRESMEIYQKEL